MTCQRGNILFLILLAIILFVALTYAVNSGMRGGGNNASSENNQAAVASIMQFFTSIENAVGRMQLVGGLKPENISFGYYYSQYGGTRYTAHDNANCTSDTCRVFKPTGGGVAAQTFETYALSDPPGVTATNVKPGFFNIILMQYPYAGTSANDIILYLANIKAEVCTEYNNRMGITSSPTITGTWVDAANVANWDNAGYTIYNNANQLVGKTSFASNLNNGYCHIVLLLIAR